MRRGMYLLAALIALAFLCYGGLVWHNNRAVPPPSAAQIDTSFERGVAWLTANRAGILQQQNPILWWMVGESARVSGDSRLQALYDEFRGRYAAAQAGSVWEIFFRPERFWGAGFSPQSYRHFADYQQYFLYSLSCSDQLADEAVIAAQGDTDFCRDTHPITPACVTHQLMGFRFAQRVGCDSDPALAEKIGVLQDKIVRQLTWDPRVVDVYLQRVLMLADSQAAHRIKPRWIERVLLAQLDDGSWSGLQPLVPLGRERYLGFNARLAGVGRVQADFHATAQGVWLASLLRAQARGQ